MTAPRQLSFQLPLDLSPSTDDITLEERIQVHNAIQVIASQLDVYSGHTVYGTSERQYLNFTDTLQVGNTNYAYMEAGESLSAGQFVTIYQSGGIAKLKKAAGPSYAGDVRGWVDESAGAGDSVKITFWGVYEYLSSLTPGNVYWASTVTAGNAMDSKPSGSGDIAQVIGFALDADTLFVRPDMLVQTIP